MAKPVSFEIPVFDENDVDQMPVDGSILFAIIRPTNGFFGGGIFRKAQVLVFFEEGIGTAGGNSSNDGGATAFAVTTPVGWINATQGT